jgi:hypothetical protein
LKAVVYDRYGSPNVLELTGIDQPVVGEDQVLVRVGLDQPGGGGAERASGRRAARGRLALVVPEVKLL